MIARFVWGLISFIGYCNNGCLEYFGCMSVGGFNEICGFDLTAPNKPFHFV